MTLSINRTLPFILTMLFAITGCETIEPTATMGDSALSPMHTDILLEKYLIGVGDTLQVSVWRNADLSTQVVVLPDGKISVPLVGDVLAAGKTTEGLADEVKKVLNNYIRQPEVTVSVLAANSSEYLQRVRITGAVNSQQSVYYRRGLTVLDLVLLAGGVSPFANANRALLYRKVDGELKLYPIKLDDILTRGELATNYQLLPADIITVPEKAF